LAAVVIVCCLASQSFAADSEKTAAKAHYEAATRLYDVHDYARALDEYKAAYLAKPDPAFLFNMGQCYRKLGNTEQGLQFYRDYLKKAPANDPNRALIEMRVRDIETGTDPDLAPKQPLVPAQPSAAPKHALEPAPTPTSPSMIDQSVGIDLTAREVTPSATTPIYKTWWFWTGVGAVVVAGVITAVVITSGGSRTLSADSALGTREALQ
jgi:tetratricopeptide (TPR) repeat protein